VTHEILHAAGFHHEQSREDRDNHVTIDFDAIDPAHKEWFEIRTGARLIGPYDYSSVMHYGRKAFSKNGDDTIIPKVPGAQIGQREGLSDLDRSALAQLYSGAPPPGTNPPGTNPPNHGFAGQYTSQRGDVSCSESAGSVSCSFPGGSILCSVNGAQLDCGWLGGGQGRAVFTRQASGVLAGSYGNLLSNNDMGAWDLVPSGGAPPPGQPPGFSIPGFPAIPGLPPLPALPALPPIPGLPAPQ
jgi:astacin